MELTSELKQRIISTVNRYTDKANAIYGTKIAYPNVIFTKRGTTAGTANYMSHTINFNPELYVRNVEAFLADTAIHELSHLVAHQVYRLGRGIRITAHGEEWKRVMRSLGVTPSRCHSFDTSETKQKKTTVRYQYKCSCQTFMVSSVRHNKMQRGFTYRCKRCNQTISYMGGSNTVKPVQVTKPINTTPTSTNIGSGTKKERAQRIYNSNKHLGRTTVIAMFKSQLNMGDAGASTYWYNCTRGK